jgi:hypothetical protein
VARIIDLDEIAPEDIVVRCNGVEYPLPGDVPIPDWLAIVAAAEVFEASEDPDATEALYERVLHLFQVRNPGLEELPIGIRQTVALIFSLYGADIEPEEDDAVPPPQASTPKTTRSQKSTPRRSAKTTATTTRSRSSS